jgi:hypothetical protein
VWSEAVTLSAGQDMQVQMLSEIIIEIIIDMRGRPRPVL